MSEKRCSAALKMEIQSQVEFYDEMDGNIVFNKTVMIIRGKDNEFFWATTKLKLTKTSTLDLEKLDKIAINLETVRPLYSARLLRAPTPVPQDSYIKEPSLIDYKENLTEESIITKLILHEIEALELLRKHPHPNIVEYRGCVLTDGRISGLCLAKYKATLYERMEAGTPFDKHLFLEGVERGIRHLHSLGIVHNDINPSNIMFDEMDRPVIIDFDCWQQNGQKLGIKMGTTDWLIEGVEFALFENDIFSLSKIKKFLFASSSRKPLTKSTSAAANASKTLTPATAQIGGPQDALDSIGKTPESHVEGGNPNTTTPPPAKTQEDEKKRRVSVEDKAKG
ncbi:hypothetical protein E4U15_004279 [Claviceps sp. LM218 group G6]|nr:hypothetical protein E4U15_004279 [Claviceps sp. LM218 group G6]